MAENNIFDKAVSPASTERTMKMTFSISPQDRILVKTYAISGVILIKWTAK